MLITKSKLRKKSTVELEIKNCRKQLLPEYSGSTVTIELENMEEDN
jgi:hypothetical protein